MALERHNPADEFDALFRRHLKQGGAPVAPCVGFDADSASAYFERALDAFAQARYETHLAGCATCRRHLVELARLHSEIETLIAKPPAGVAEPVWSRWYGAVAQWFEFSGWNWGWTAGATACGLLLAVLATGTWQRLSTLQHQSATMALRSAPEPQNDAPSFNANAQPTGLSDLQATSAPAAGGIVSNPETQLNRTQPGQTGLLALAQDKQLDSRVTVPVPATPPRETLLSLGSSLAPSALQPEVRAIAAEINNTYLGTQPVPPPPGLTAAPVGFSQNLQGLRLPVNFGSQPAIREPSRIALKPNEFDKQDIVARLVLPEPQRARDEAAKSAADEKAASDPAAAARSRALMSVLNKGRASGFMPFKNDDTRTKEADVKEVKEQLKPLMKHLNGHTFYFDHGYWIDEQYKSDTTLPIVPLTKGNEKYQKVLIENPSLEQFFELGQVIVVWKGKVYDVRK